MCLDWIMQVTWDSIDKIYCISVAERTDRLTEARAQFLKVGLAQRVEFVIVEKHPENCEQGIFESHRLCMQKGLDADAERILIFEDDIVFDRVTPEILARCMNFINLHEQWHMLFWGCMVMGSKPTAYPSIVQVKYRSLTQGYVVHRRFAESFVERQWEKVPYDDYLRDLKDDQMYALYPSIAFQSNSRSDNERYLPLDRFRRLCGGLQKIQKRNEIYHRHKGLIVGAHIVICLLLLFLIFMP
jgi:GR25 family glycosyltransferase involved in LPS biosynthesis